MHPTYYRGCWHVVSRCLFERYTHPEGLAPSQKRFTTRRPSSRTRRRCIRLAPIVQYSPLLPPVGVWAVSQSQCGRSPSQAGYPSKPWWAVTPHQADRTRPHPIPMNLSQKDMHPTGASGITTRFQELFRCMGQVGHALLTRSPLSPRSKLLGSRSTCMC